MAAVDSNELNIVKDLLIEIKDGSKVMKQAISSWRER
jgi:hypothetical protein